MIPRRALSVTLALAASWLTGGAEAAASTCNGSGPGATLLFPFIAVDFESAESEVTQISITNTSREPVLTNVVVWSHCGLPVLDFPLHLRGHEVKPIDLRQLLVEGRIPPSGELETASFPACASPLEPSHLDAEERASLAARLGGRPDPGDGLCYATPTPEAEPSMGFITVDVVEDCSLSMRTPLDDGYFGERAGSRNVLAGDFFLLDAAEDSAQGFAAVSIRADAERLAEASIRSFYGLNDDRLPLGTSYRTRFLNGGAFDGGTELLVWAQNLDFSHLPTEAPCGASCGGSSLSAGLVIEAREQAAVMESSPISVPFEGSPTRFKVGAEGFETPGDFGSLDISGLTLCGVCSPVEDRNQIVVLPVYRAEGRFSAGLRGITLEDPCL